MFPSTLTPEQEFTGSIQRGHAVFGAQQPQGHRRQHRDHAHLRARGGADLAQRLADLENTTEALAQQHDTFSRNTRAQLKQVFDALREVMTPPEPPKRPIGFVTPEDKGKKPTASKRKT
jgi:hypothetical protein